MDIFLYFLIFHIYIFQASSNMRLHTAAAGVIWECEDKYDIKGKRRGYVHRRLNTLFMS